MDSEAHEVQFKVKDDVLDTERNNSPAWRPSGSTVASPLSNYKVNPQYQYLVDSSAEQLKTVKTLDSQ